MRTVIIAGAFVVLLFVAFLYSLCRWAERDDATRRVQAEQWLAFTMQHHCSIVRNPSFGNPTATWRCDGNFEVVR